MSQISVLGFRQSSASSSSSDLSGGTHWAILISPHPPSTKPQKSKSRFFHAWSSAKEPQSESVLFDMHKHQLRQQPFPLSLKEGSSTNTPQSDLNIGCTPGATTRPNQPCTALSSTTGNVPTSSPQPTPEVVKTTTLNADSSHPLQLILRISASILPQGPPCLVPKLSQRLSNTPTYGPETDWLRSALSTMHDGLLEPGFDVDKFFEYVNSAAKEYAMYEASSEENNAADSKQQHLQAARKETSVLALDYSAHIARITQVKAMLTPPQSPKISPYASHQPQPPPPPPPQQQQKKSHTWLGFRISPSPSSMRSRRCTAEQRHSFERQDDPYSGLM